MNDRKTNGIYSVPKKQADAFLPWYGQMPTNLNKILYTCRQVNFQANVENFSVKMGTFRIFA